MKIRVVNTREETFTLHPNERVVHLVFRPSNRAVLSLAETYAEKHSKKEHCESKMLVS